MRKLYKEFFYISNTDKIRDKVMLARVGVTVVIMVICLFAMSITAYAYFTANDIVLPDNYIKSAKYELDIVVNDGENDVILTNNQFVAAAGKTYTVTLTYVEEDFSAKTGFGVITVGDRVYHTQQIGDDVNATNGKRSSITFNVLATGTGNISVNLSAHWGTSSRYVEGEGEGLIGDGSTIDLELVNNELLKLYTVKDGDNLEAIAALYGVSVDNLVAYNQIVDKNTIAIDQVIKIPPATWVAPPVSTDETVPEEQESEQPTPEASE